jgi:hypothetical protein
MFLIMSEKIQFRWLTYSIKSFVLTATLFGASGLTWAQSDGTLYQCPGNLFTNDMDAVQARLQGCSLIVPGRITQGVVPDFGHAAPIPASVVPVKKQKPSTTPDAAAPTNALNSAENIVQPSAPKLSPAQPAAAIQVPPPAVALSPPPPTAPAPLQASNPKLSSRDQDTQAILRAELARTQAAQLVLQRTDEPVQTSAQIAAKAAAKTAALSRLRADEVALQRELSRFNP